MDAISNMKTNDCESREPKAKRSKLTIEKEEPFPIMGYPGSMDMLFQIVEKMKLSAYVGFVLSNKRMFNICVNSASVKKEFPIFAFNVAIIEEKITFEIPGYERIRLLNILETMKLLRIKVWVMELRIKSTFDNSRLLELSDLLSSLNINEIRCFNAMKGQECWDELPSFLKKFSIREVQMVNKENRGEYNVIKSVEIPENRLEEFFFGSENVKLNRFNCFGVIDEDLILNSKIPELKIVNHFIPVSLLKAVLKKFTTCDLLKCWSFESVETMVDLSQLVDSKEVIDFNFDGPLYDLRPLFVQGTPPASPLFLETIFVYRKDGRVMIIQRKDFWFCIFPLSVCNNVVVPNVLADFY